MLVENSAQAVATLRLDVIREVTTAPTARAATNVVKGLWKTGGNDMPVCVSAIGAQGTPQPLRLAITDAPGSSLSVHCPYASRLTLENVGGICLQAGWVRAPNIVVKGTGPTTIFVRPDQTPTGISVSGLAGPKAGLVVYLSQWQQHGNSLRPFDITGTLKYPAATDAITVIGCNAKRVLCLVTDSTGKRACRTINKCVNNVSAAKAALLLAVNSTSPCATPREGN